jgi:hypothetical protein
MHEVIEVCDRVLRAGGELVELSRMILQTTAGENTASVKRGGEQQPLAAVGTATAQTAGPDASVPRQLPAEARGFVGRSRELATLDALATGDRISGMRLIVVVGTAGVGKSALVVRFAHRVRARFPDGQLFVNLRGYGPEPPLSATAVLERFLRALGEPTGAVPIGLEERAELYRSLLAERRALVVLDNAATAAQVRPLLPGGPGCLVLVTSRGRLSALSAREGARRLTLGLLDEPDAVALIQTVTADYRQGDDAEQITRLATACARLPLALRIAAERAAARPWMPLEDLIADLRSHFTLWDALSSDEGTKADAVRTVLSWSYRALPTAVARAFRLLGLHPGADFGPESAAGLLDLAPEQARSLLDALAAAHLLEQTGPQRYQFHDLLRAYAADQADTGELPEKRRAALKRVTAWYLGAAHAAGKVAQTASRGALDTLATPQHAANIRFEDARDVVDWYRLERANLLEAARIADRERFDQVLWRLALALEDVLDAAGALEERGEFARLGLAAARRCGEPLAEAAMLQTLGYAHTAVGDLQQAADSLHDALALCTRLDYPEGVIRAANSLGLIHLRRRELPEAALRFEQVAEHARPKNLGEWLALAINNLAYVRLRQGLLNQAAVLAQQAQDAYQEAGAGAADRVDPFLVAAMAFRERGETKRAGQQIAAARASLTRGGRHLRYEVLLTAQEAALALADGRAEQALKIYRQCEQFQRQLADPELQADILSGTAHTMIALGLTHEAIDFHRRALALYCTRPHDAFRIAEAESALADTLSITDATTTESDEACSLRRRAFARLKQFIDPRATTLQTQLAERLRATG